MNRKLDDDLAYMVLSLVSEIPKGMVMSYGQIAKVIGRKKNARLVGTILSNASYYGDFPCHRVVNHKGRLAPGFDEQEALLRSEGVEFRNDGCIDMKKHQWKI